MWVKYNPNPAHNEVGDCTVRAICKATGEDWDKVYVGLTAQGLIMKDMPSANHVWGAYLRKKGFCRKLVDDKEKDIYTVEDFAADHQSGVFILAIDGHVVCVKNGDYYDSWDSGKQIPIYYWGKCDEDIRHDD